MQRHDLQLFADYYQFYLQDDDSEYGDLSEAWTDEAMERALAVAPHVVGIGWHDQCRRADLRVGERLAAKTFDKAAVAIRHEITLRTRSRHPPPRGSRSGRGGGDQVLQPGAETVRRHAQLVPSLAREVLAEGNRSAREHDEQHQRRDE